MAMTLSNTQSAFAWRDNATAFIDRLPSLTRTDRGQSVWVLLGLYALALGLFLKGRRSRRINPKGLPLPPGPKRLPIIGNALDIPTTDIGRRFRDMAKEYDDAEIIHFDALGQPLLVICKYDAAMELLDRRAANSSSRPSSAMAELAGWDWGMALIPYGLDWRRRRKEFHQFFHPNAIVSRRPLQQHQTAKMIQRLIEQPDTLFSQLRLTFAATILRISYGIEIKDETDEYVLVNEAALMVFSQAFMPGAFLVETFPILRYLPSWLPGAGFIRLMAGWKKIVHRMRDMPFERTLKAIDDGTAEPSIARDMLERMFSDPNADIELEKLVARDVASISYAAGGDTANNLNHTNVLPCVQEKARRELDAVVGSSRMPTFEDRDQLPYITAIAKECMRWQSVTPLGVPHLTLEDDEYNGYFIPAGSSILPNQWAMSRDERVYPDPETFNPDRFMKNGKLNTEVQDPETFFFGFGRRICAGRHFAQTSMYIMIASVLHTLIIDRAKDEHGQPIIPEVKMTDGILSYPTAYRYSIRARSPRHEAVVRAAVREGKEAS
ncbi:CyP450 monooxygenase [Daedaleopsis nitida]|nr:CyP450 monooxygenase [Daedaleopsis nitida]